MSSLLGWFDSRTEGSPPESVLAAMAQARSLPASSRCIQCATEALALSAEGRKKEADLYSDNAMWASVVGRPRWNDADLAAVAAQKGHASSLIEAYRRHGDGFFRFLRGAFSLALFDMAASRVLLAIDRFGIGSMYYSTPTPGGLVFGSSADHVAAHPAVDHTISDQSVFNFLYFGICPSPGTIYREQFKLLPAQYLVYSKGIARTGFYWSVPYRETTNQDLKGLTQELMRLLRGAVKRAIEDEQTSEIGAFLSGGLDSSTVVGLLSEAIGRTKSFTIGFSHDRYDESHYAEITAKHFRAEQHNHFLTPGDVVRALPQLARASDEPFGNSSVVPAYYCAKMAQENGISLMLAGDGGDEIFAGNSRYVDQEILGLYSRLPAIIRRSLIEPIAFGLPRFERWSVGRRAQNYIRRARLPMPERLEAYNFYRNADLGEVFETDALAAFDPNEPLANLREAYERTQSSSMLQRMLHLDLKVTLADNDLRKVGIACDMAGVAVAFPFLDDDVVEFAAQIPPSLLIRRFKRRWFFRQAVKGFLAPETLAKRKHGFGMPYSEWPRQNPELRQIATDCLHGFRRRHYLRSDFLDRMAGSEAAACDSLIWDIMMLELWLRERESSRSNTRTKTIAA
jgi:asparagine synthase (glutamine-hydrolysing)